MVCLLGNDKILILLFWNLDTLYNCVCVVGYWLAAVNFFCLVNIHT